jgi:hypothetical protein
MWWFGRVNYHKGNHKRVLINELVVDGRTLTAKNELAG